MTYKSNVANKGTLQNSTAASSSTAFLWTGSGNGNQTGVLGGGVGNGVAQQAQQTQLGDGAGTIFETSVDNN